MASKRKESTKDAARAPQAQHKKAKKDPMVEQFNEIIASWEAASATDEVKKMLAEILPCSLGEFSDQRHRFQEKVVEAVAGIMADAEAAYSKQITETRAELDEAGNEKPQRDKDATEAAAEVEVAKAETLRLKAILAESALAFRARTVALDEAHAAKKLDAQKSQEAVKQKADFETALEDLCFLKTVSSEESEASPKQEELLMLLKRYQVEESLMTALPVALAKAPDARGQFDLIAIGQVETEISKKIAEQESIISAAEPGQKQCEAAVQRAQEQLDEAMSAQRDAARTFDTASKHQSSCEEASTAAQKAVRALASSLKRLAGAVNSAEAELEIFQQGPLETFKTLRNRATPPPVVEEEVAVPPPIEEQAMEEVQEPEQPAVAAC